MYCINCGEKLVEGAKFCHRCGTKQPFSSMSSTRSYPPVQEERTDQDPHLDGPKSIEQTMHTTSNLVDLIQEVDERINSEITRHTVDQTEDDPKFIGPKKPENPEPTSTKNNTQPIKKISSPQPEEADLPFTQKKETPKDLEKSYPRPREEKPLYTSKNQEKSTSFSSKIKNLWHSFIHEEDDEYSIFSALKSQPAPQEDIQKNITDAEKVPMENIEQKASPESIDFTSDAKALKNFMDKNHLNKDKIAQQKHSELENKKRLERIRQRNMHLETKEDSDYLYYPDTFNHLDFEEMDSLEENDLSKSQKIIFTPDLLEEETKKSFSDKVKTSLNGIFSKDKKTSKKPSVKKEKNKEKTTAFSLTKEDLEAPSSPDDKPLHPKKTSAKTEKFDDYMEIVHDHIYDGLEKLHETGKKGVLFLAIIGLVFCLLPIAVVGRSYAAILYGLLKVLMTVFIFYKAHSVAYDHVPLKIEPSLKNIGCLANWSLCQIVLGILFFLYPRKGVLGFNMLGALTPTIWATLIYYCISCLFAQALLWHRLKGTSKIQFLGWYSISFITLDLISKIIWILLNFLLTLQ